MRRPEQFQLVVLKGQLYTQKQEEDFKTQTKRHCRNGKLRTPRKRDYGLFERTMVLGYI